MRAWILVFLLSWLGRSACGQSLEWLTDIQAAREKAKNEGKLVLVYFTGSDWCPWCKRLKSEALDRPEFLDFARANLVLVEADFPRYKAMPQLQHVANTELQKTYHVTHFPTLVVLNQNGNEVKRMGYVAGGAPALIAKLDRPARINNQSLQAHPAVDRPERPRKPATWTPPPPPIEIHYGPLALKAISGPKDRRIVLINNASLMTGETAKVRAEDKEVVVVCKEIREESVLITCDGKDIELTLPGK
jgi:protein disulfide-isomerase